MRKGESLSAGDMTRFILDDAWLGIVDNYYDWLVAKGDCWHLLYPLPFYPHGTGQAPDDSIVVVGGVGNVLDAYDKLTASSWNLRYV